MSVFTEAGYKAMLIMVLALTNDELVTRHRRALAVEASRYRHEMAAFRTGNPALAPERPAREKQIEIEIIETAMRDRCMAIPAH